MRRLVASPLLAPLMRGQLLVGFGSSGPAPPPVASQTFNVDTPHTPTGKIVNYNLVQRVRASLYILKRQYGCTIDIYKLNSSSTDQRTGLKTIVTTTYHIVRAPVLPSKVERADQKNISVISANKEFAMGGSYDAGQREFIVDRRDCPRLPDLTADDWIVYNGQRWQIRSFEELEVRAGWNITARRLVGEIPNQVIQLAACDIASLQDSGAN